MQVAKLSPPPSTYLPPPPVILNCRRRMLTCVCTRFQEEREGQERGLLILVRFRKSSSFIPLSPLSSLLFYSASNFSQQRRASHTHTTLRLRAFGNFSQHHTSDPHHSQFCLLVCSVLRNSVCSKSRPLPLLFLSLCLSTSARAHLTCRHELLHVDPSKLVEERERDTSLLRSSCAHYTLGQIPFGVGGARGVAEGGAAAAAVVVDPLLAAAVAVVAAKVSAVCLGCCDAIDDFSVVVKQD